MLSHGWMTASEVSDIVAIAEMTPGPLGLNSATFAGLRTADLPGAIFAVLGVLTPTFTLCFLAAVMFQRFRTSHRLEQIMTGVRPASIGLLAGVCVSLSITNFSTAAGGVNLPAVGIGMLNLSSCRSISWACPDHRDSAPLWACFSSACWAYRPDSVMDEEDRPGAMLPGGLFCSYRARAPFLSLISDFSKEKFQN